MKLRLGSSILFLLHAKKVPTTAFSSPISSSSSLSLSSTHRFKRNIITSILRGGSGGGSGSSSDTNYNPKKYQATISPEETSSSSSLSNNNNENLDQQTKDEIIKAAVGSIHITGPSTFIDSFAGIPFVNTSRLQQPNRQQQQQQPNQQPNQHRVLFVLGGPGAGKGTQSENIVKEYKCIHLSVGELLRKERERGDDSPHAELIEECLVAGKIVPVEISLNLVKNAMDDATTISSTTTSTTSYGQPIFLVDGFPRNYDNLSGWTTNMPHHATCIGSLVYDCSMDVLEQRILSRAATSGRSDDNLESARKRFKTFQQQTMPVVYALEEVEKMQIVNDACDIGRLHVQHIVGEESVDEVWDATKEAMNGYITNDVLSANKSLLACIESKDVDTYASLTCMEMLSLSSESESDDDDDDNKSKEMTVSSSSSSDLNVNNMDMENVKEAFQQYELLDTCPDGIINHITNAQIDVTSGTKVIVSYDRQIEDKGSGEIKSQFRETRVWSHESKGWICIHFARKPLNS